MDDREYVFRLFARKLSGNASGEELEQLRKSLNNNPELQFYNELINLRNLMKGIWKSGAIYADVNESAHCGEYGTMMHHWLPKRSQPGWGKIYRLVLAAVAIVLVGGFALLKATAGEKYAPYPATETATTKGSESTGKTAWWHCSDAEMPNCCGLKYDENFNKTSRRRLCWRRSLFRCA